MRAGVEFFKRHRVGSSMILLAIWVLVFYAFALRLPFFHDDLPIMTWIEHHGWHDVLFSTENGYYRPLTFVIYKLGAVLLPVGARQVALHAVNLVTLWAGAYLLLRLVLLCEGNWGLGLLAAVLYVAFPFSGEAVAWITAVSHPLVAALTLLATYAALTAETESNLRYWGLSLLATGLAPLAHESGVVCGAIVGGVVLIQRGLGEGWRRRLAGIALGGLLNAVAVGARYLTPGVDTVSDVKGLSDLFQNFMCFVHGLLYPLGPLLGQLILKQGWHDFTLIGLSGLLFSGLLLWIAFVTRKWRWLAGGLWWWIWGALPAIISLEYGALFVGSRLYSLSSVGIVLLWTGVLVGLVRWARAFRAKRLVLIVLIGFIVLSGYGVNRRRRALSVLLDDLYDEVLVVAASQSREASLGFVNLPSSLTWEERVYPLVTEYVLFVPGWSSLAEFVERNFAWRDVHTAVYPAIMQKTDPFWLTQGPWLDGDGLRAFLVARDGIWLARYDDATARFVLLEVGRVTPETTLPLAEPLARFTGGPLLLAADIAPAGARQYAITLEWWAAAPAEATVFLHVRDQAGNVVAQADGAALGGTFALPLWRDGDLIRDVRYVTVPETATGPFTVQAGIYKGAVRFPATSNSAPVMEDAVTVGTFAPAP